MAFTEERMTVTKISLPQMGASRLSTNLDRSVAVQLQSRGIAAA